MKDSVAITLPMGKRPVFPTASFFGRKTLGSKFVEYLIPLTDFTMEGLVNSKATISRDQPFLSEDGKKQLKELRKQYKLSNP